MEDELHYSEGALEPTQDTAPTNLDGSQPSMTQRTSPSSTVGTVSSVMSKYFAAGLDHLVSISSSEFVIPSETKWKMVKLTDEDAFDSIPQIDRLKDEAILDSLTAYIHWNFEFCEKFFDMKQEFPIEIFWPRSESLLGTFALLVGNMANSAGSFGGAQDMRLTFTARANIDRITSQCVCQLNKEGHPYALVTLIPSKDERRFGENCDGPPVLTRELGIRWKRSVAAAADFSQKS